jgi:hypothetical protein
MMTGLLFHLGLGFTGERFSLFQKSRYAVGVPFVRVVAERMTKFMADREIKKAHPVHVPLQQQFAISHRHFYQFIGTGWFRPL